MATLPMDLIKKKMQQMIKDKINAMDRADQAEQKVRDLEEKNEFAEQETNLLKKKISQLDQELDVVKAQLDEANNKLEEDMKRLADAEQEVFALKRRMRHLDENLERAELRLQQEITKLEASEANDRKYEEATCKLLVLNELDIERTNKEEILQHKTSQLEEELRLCNNALKLLERNMEKAIQREEMYEEQIRYLSGRLENIENQARYSERQVLYLQKEVEYLQNDLSNKELQTEQFKISYNAQSVEHGNSFGLNNCFTKRRIRMNYELKCYNLK